MDMTQLQEPVMSARADLVAIPEELHDVLVQIDNQAVDRRYVDFAAMAERLEECIEKVLGSPETPLGRWWSDGLLRWARFLFDALEHIRSGGREGMAGGRLLGVRTGRIERLEIKANMVSAQCHSDQLPATGVEFRVEALVVLLV
jgi:hypothetical protein